VNAKKWKGPEKFPASAFYRIAAKIAILFVQGKAAGGHPNGKFGNSHGQFPSRSLDFNVQMGSAQPAMDGKL